MKYMKYLAFFKNLSGIATQKEGAGSGIGGIYLYKVKHEKETGRRNLES